MKSIVAGETWSDGISSGQQSRSAGRAEGSGCQMVTEFDSLSGDTIDVRRPNGAVAKASDVANAQIVC